MRQKVESRSGDLVDQLCSMARIDPGVDAFIGKMDRWREEFILLRALCLEAGLEEGLKWRQPCYMADGKNVVVLQGFKEDCALGFFQGVLMQDPAGLMFQPTQNSQSARRVSFRSAADIQGQHGPLVELLKEGARVAKSGEKVQFKETDAFELPAELEAAFAADAAFKAAFGALTPGRQRGYILHFSGAKQSATREARIRKHRERILLGKGLQDR